MQWMIGNLYFLQGQRANSIIIHKNDGYYYHRHHDTDRPQSLFVDLKCTRCKFKNLPCKAYAVIPRNCMYLQIVSPHNHMPDPWYAEELLLREKIFATIGTGDPGRFSVIIRNIGIGGGHSLEARSRLSRARLRSSLWRRRLAHFPPIPDTLEELGHYLLMQQYHSVTQTYDGADNIFAGVCGNYQDGTLCVVFASARMLQFLMTANTIFTDGTFKKRPQKPQSNQMFNISCVWHNPTTTTKHIVTCVRVLMQSRTQATYRVLIQFLKALMPGWNPEIIMCDHERGQVNAWLEAFIHAILSTCIWHFAVDVFRYTRTLGLWPLMMNNCAVDALVRACCALPLLPSNRIPEGLIALGLWGRFLGVLESPLVRDLFGYIEREWIPQREYLSVFGVEDRTNNVSESVNSSLRSEIPENRPNCWVLIRAFLRLEDQAVVDLQALRQGRNVQRSQTLTTLRNDTAIANLTDSFVRGYINIVEFLLNASKRLQAPYDHVFN